MVKSIENILHVLVKSLSIALIFLCILIKFDMCKPVIISSTLMVLQALLLIEYRNFKPFAIFIFFTMSYTLVPFWYFGPNQFPIMSYTFDFDDIEYYTGTLIILSIFWAIFSLLLPKIKSTIVLNEYIKIKDNALVFYSYIIIFILIILFGKSGDSILSGTGYGQTEISSVGGTALYEYGGLLYLVAYTFSGNKKVRKLILITAGIFYCSKSLLLGVRGNTLFIMLLMFILHLDNRKISLLQWMLIGSPVVILFIIFGMLRGDIGMGVEGLTSQMGNATEENFLFFRIVLGNQYDIYYASTRLYGFCETGIISASQRVESLFYNILAFIVPYGKLPEIANLSAYRNKEFYSGGGLLAPINFYVYMSYYGVIILAAFLAFIFRKVMVKGSFISQNMLVYVVLLLSTYASWYGYGANNIYKFCVYGVLAFAIANIIDKAIGTQGSSLKIEHADKS